MLTNTMPFREDVDNAMIIDAQRHRRYRFSSKLGLSEECKNTVNRMMTFDALIRPVCQRSYNNIIHLLHSIYFFFSEYFRMCPSSLVQLFWRPAANFRCHQCQCFSSLKTPSIQYRKHQQWDCTWIIIKKWIKDWWRKKCTPRYCPFHFPITLGSPSLILLSFFAYFLNPNLFFHIILFSY